MSERHSPPRKRFGQHFLTDPRILARIADAAQIAPTDTVIEIGPGRCALTDELARRAGRLIAIEIDRDLAASARTHFADAPHVSIVEGDVLAQDLHALAGGPFILAGNIPYNITTPILFHALAAPRPTRAVYLVQREVADRVAAAPGSEAYGALSANVQAVATAVVAFKVPAGAFQPPPKVESAVLVIEPLAVPVIEPALEVRYRRFVQAAFGMRRKQMLRVLRSITGCAVEEGSAQLAEAGIEATLRPEVLTPDDFARLIRVLARREG
ncbi:MAG: 16S rRNA (adenine(1518)-N(6)/adenine(1519)-N(6))-dimethyltransferase RsmA [Gemmatimonadaceae bacterium]|nr:16S rRNA (adenine(1518)-N(6)/adenine(1519)-N(6))-dimethyltransferase RsmA [Gemmatimonadaceae bacterium]